MLPSAVVLLDADFKLQKWNEQFAKLVQMADKVLPEQSLFALGGGILDTVEIRHYLSTDLLILESNHQITVTMKDGRRVGITGRTMKRHGSNAKMLALMIDEKGD